METKDWLLVLGVCATFVLGIANLIYNLHTGRRTAFVNTVTSERIKWIGKMRDNVSRLLAQCESWLSGTGADREETIRQVEQLKAEIQLQINPKDEEDAALEKLIEGIPSRNEDFNPNDFLPIRKQIIAATQAMLKREWDKVKDEAVEGDLRKRKMK